MKKIYWMIILLVATLPGCGDVEWLPADTTTASPSLSVAFSPESITTAGSSTVTFTIKNSTGNPAQSGLNFVAQFDPSLELGNVPFSQCGGNAVASTDLTRLIFNAGAFPAGTTDCTVTATIRGTTPGSYTITSSDISGLSSNLVNGVTDKTLTVTSTTAPTLTKTYQPTTILAGESTTLAFTITNGTGSPAQSGLGFTDTLDANLSVTVAPDQCGGTVSASGSQVTFSGGQLAAGTGNCVINATVTGTTPGSYVNGSAAITGLAGGLVNGVSDQTLTISLPPVTDSTGVVSVSILDVTPPSNTTGTVVTFTASLNTDNNSQNTVNILIGFVGVDAAGNDIQSTANFAEANGITPGQLQFTVPLDAPTSELGNIAYWRITEVTIQ